MTLASRYLLRHPNGNFLTLCEININCPDGDDEREFDTAVADYAWEVKEEYEWAMNRIGVDVQVAVVYVTLETQWSVVRWADGGLRLIDPVVTWRNGTFP